MKPSNFHDEKPIYSLSKNILLLRSSLSDRSSLCNELRRSNYQMHLVADEESLQLYVDFYRPNSILLDYRDASDINTCRRISSKYPLPLFVIGEYENEDCVAACLDAGADDYITEPISAVELAARIGAAIRARNSHYLKPSNSAESVIYSDLEIDITTMDIRCEGRSARLSSVELGLFELLILQYPNAMCRDRATRVLFFRDWVPGDRTVDVTLGRLRSKLRSVSRNLDIMTIRGIGYLLSDRTMELNERHILYPENMTPHDRQ